MTNFIIYIYGYTVYYIWYYILYIVAHTSTRVLYGHIIFHGQVNLNFAQFSTLCAQIKNEMN